MRAISSKYKSLRVGDVKFVDGVADVNEAQAVALASLPESFEVVVESFGDDSEKKTPVGDSSSVPFDPSEHNADEVRSYLASIDDADADAHDAEVARILEAEKAGKNRKGIVEAIEGTPAQ